MVGNGLVGYTGLRVAWSRRRFAFLACVIRITTSLAVLALHGDIGSRPAQRHRWT